MHPAKLYHASCAQTYQAPLPDSHPAKLFPTEHTRSCPRGRAPSLAASSRICQERQHGRQHTWRCTEHFLGAGIDGVDLPVVCKHRHRPQRAHRVHQQQRAMLATQLPDSRQVLVGPCAALPLPCIYLNNLKAVRDLAQVHQTVSACQRMLSHMPWPSACCMLDEVEHGRHQCLPSACRAAPAGCMGDSCCCGAGFHLPAVVATLLAHAG